MEWEHIADRLSVVRAALNEYDWATKRDALSAWEGDRWASQELPTVPSTKG